MSNSRNINDRWISLSQHPEVREGQEGFTYYNTRLKNVYVWSGVEWVEVPRPAIIPQHTCEHQIKFDYINPIERGGIHSDNEEVFKQSEEYKLMILSWIVIMIRVLVSTSITALIFWLWYLYMVN